MMTGRRLDYEIGTALETSLVTARAGVPTLIEAFFCKKIRSAFQRLPFVATVLICAQSYLSSAGQDEGKSLASRRAEWACSVTNALLKTTKAA